MIVTAPRLTLICAAVLAALAATVVQAEDYSKSFAVTGRPVVRVKADDGNVRVSTSDTPQVEFRVNYQGFELNRNLFVEARQNGSEVQLTTRAKGGLALGFSRKHVDIDIRMPRDADLRLQTGDGNVEVSALNGDISLHTGDGRLQVSQLSGKIDLHSGDGGISADTLKGDVRLRTGDGGIAARNLDGNCDVKSGDGGIRIAGRFDALEVASGDGGVVVHVTPGSRLSETWSITTGDGPVELKLPADLKANLEAHTSDGHIHLGVPVGVLGHVSPSRVQGTLNGGGPSLTVRSSDGPIRIEGI
jgi:hypothetical protein